MTTRNLSISCVLGLSLTLALLGMLSIQQSPVVAAPTDTTRYVAVGGTDAGNDCTSANSPCETIQQAVDAANSGDTIKVASGTYTRVNSQPVPQGYPGHELWQVVYVDKSVTIRGGYSTADWTTSDPASHATTVDAHGEGRAVVIIGDVSPAIEGLRLTGGDAEDLGGSGNLDWFVTPAGGGLYVLSGTATISNNVIYDNRAGFGGGVHLNHSNSLLISNDIYSNTAWLQGGGLYAEGSEDTLSGNEIYDNDGTYAGGGVIVARSRDVILTDNHIYSNASARAGALSAATSNLELRRNRISGNSAEAVGGVVLESSEVSVVNNVIADNDTSGSGGHSGLYVAPGDRTWLEASYPWLSSFRVRLLHNTIARNTGGSGVYVTSYESGSNIYHANVAMTNTVLVNHQVGVSVTDGNTVTIDGVLWHNTPTTVAAPSTAILDVRSEYTGDPAFAQDGYHIIGGSAAIDRGTTAGLTTDVDQQPRPVGQGPDLGADEVMESSELDPTTGGTLTYTDTRGTVTSVEVPAGAVTDPVSLMYSPASEPAQPTPSGFRFAGVAFYLEVYSDGVDLANYQFEEPVQVTIHYSDASLQGIDEETLRLEYWDGTDWQDAACGAYERHPEENWLSVPICHLTPFGLFGSPPSAPVGGYTEPMSRVRMVTPWLPLAVLGILALMGSALAIKRSVR